MQQELLLEFFCEEIPARMQKNALRDSKELFEKILNESGAEFSNVESFVSPRRITIKVEHLVQKTKGISEEKRGPKINAPDSAIAGFLKSNGMKKTDLTTKDGYYYLHVSLSGVDIRDILKEMIEDFIKRFPWQKSMRWCLAGQDTLSAFWVRPIRSIMCIYDGAPVKLTIDSVGLTTCDHTFGHRFLSSEFIRVFDFDDYVQKLEKNYVMLDYYKKKAYIDRELTQKAAAMGLCLMIDDDLLSEVTGLVEYPFIHIGTIDEKFMKLPPAVLSTSMKVHQKYFTLTYPDSVVAPFYGTITNVPGTDIMYDGLDRVLRARLADAAFFYKEDTDATLEAFSQRLSNVVFHEKLGTMAQKIDRMMSVANSKEEHRAIVLCKADLLTQMVGEFPELQGVIGEEYAKIQDEEPDVCVAIREHYKPAGAGDVLPETKIGARISFFDKLDTLVGFLGVGIYPTGSKDPFALRRAALCIVRLLCDFKESILDGESFSWYIETLITAYSDQGVALDQDVQLEVKEFLLERLKVYMSDKIGIDADIVEAVVSSFCVDEFNFKDIIKKAKELQELSEHTDFQLVRDAYKRAVGVIGDSEVIPNSNISDLAFNDHHMKRLQDAVIDLSCDTGNFEDILRASKAVLDACDNVLINDPDSAIKNRNLRLFKEFVKLIGVNLS